MTDSQFERAIDRTGAINGPGYNVVTHNCHHELKAAFTGAGVRYPAYYDEAIDPGGLVDTVLTVFER